MVIYRQIYRSIEQGGRARKPSTTLTIPDERLLRGSPSARQRYVRTLTGPTLRPRLSSRVSFVMLPVPTAPLAQARSSPWGRWREDLLALVLGGAVSAGVLGTLYNYYGF